MKFLYSLLLLIFVNLSLVAQENIFLNRGYWKAKPTLDMIKADIEKGNDATAFNSYKFDATVYALLEKADLSIIKYLVSIPENGLDKITHDGRNYLLWAGYSGDLEVIKYLIHQGSDLHHVDEHGYGLVTFTALGGNSNPEIYQEYIAQGLSLAETNREGANALLLASSSVEKLEDLSYFLENGLSLNDTDDQGNNIFLYAVSKGNVAFLQELVDAGIDYKKINDHGENAVMVAAEGARRHSNQIGVFRFLKQLNLDFNLSNDDGKTALHYVAYNNPNQDVFEYLIEEGIEPNRLDHEGSPAIFNAVAYNNRIATHVLWAFVQDFNKQNNLGESLLSKAIQGRNTDITIKLLDRNVDLQQHNAENESYINQLFSSYREKDKAYFEKFFEIFRAKGVQPSVNTNDGHTIFHIAVNKNSLYLLNQAAKISNDINLPNTKGLTPLQEAVLVAKDTELLKALLAAGADKNVKTEFDETVYDLAQENEALEGIDIEFLK